LTLEKELIEQCLKNDRQAQFKLYNKYSDAMYNICRRMIVREDESMEVLQDAFVNIFQKLKTFNYENSLGSWIKRIVINKCIDFLRVKKQMFFEIDTDHMAIPETPEENPPKVNADVIYKAIDSLPAGFRTVFTMYAIEGFDHEEIAMVLNISEQTSKSQYHRAKQKLKEILTNGNINHLYN
jgi:RNA polymerase sigma factor (sigma-70 family)